MEPAAAASLLPKVGERRPGTQASRRIKELEVMVADVVVETPNTTTLNWRAAVEGAGVALTGGPTAFAVYHCGRRILNTHRKRREQFDDWKRIDAALARMSNDPVGPDGKAQGTT
jgi:hypothetical protein